MSTSAAAILSAPFPGPPTLPFDTAAAGSHRAEPRNATADIEADLGRLLRPRKHYQRYYTTRSANDDMCCAPEGVGTFLRAYFHYKSANWKGNKPDPLADLSAEELAKMPTYYVMDRDQTMAETVRPFAPSATEIAGNHWLPEAEIAVYTEEYERTGFQGGLNSYRASLEPQLIADLPCSRARQLKCLRCLSPAKATGAHTRCQAPWTECVKELLHT